MDFQMNQNNADGSKHKCISKAKTWLGTLFWATSSELVNAVI